VGNDLISERRYFKQNSRDSTKKILGFANKRLFSNLPNLEIICFQCNGDFNPPDFVSIDEIRYERINTFIAFDAFVPGIRLPNLRLLSFKQKIFYIFDIARTPIVQRLR
jgi:hypothetical protein